MASFPLITPSSRLFTLGEYPHTPFQAWSGIETRIRHSNVVLSSTLKLGFISLAEADMLAVVSHYDDHRGGYLAFDIPAQVLSGVSAPGDYTLTGYTWRYVEPPQIEDIPCAGYSVELTLESVPPQNVSVSGLIL